MLSFVCHMRPNRPVSARSAAGCRARPPHRAGLIRSAAGGAAALAGCGEMVREAAFSRAWGDCSVEKRDYLKLRAEPGQSRRARPVTFRRPGAVLPAGARPARRRRRLSADFPGQAGRRIPIVPLTCADVMQGRACRKPEDRNRREAEMTFPNLPVATVRVARITQRDKHLRGSSGTRNERFAPGGRLVTGRDGNMASEGHIGHPAQAPRWSLE